MAGSQALGFGETFTDDALWEPGAAVRHYLTSVPLAPPAPEIVPLSLAAGRVLATEATADGPYPAAPRSTMDGFAVRAVEGDRPRRVVGEVRMGRAPTGPVGPGEAMRIPTGGVVPPGADAVVPVEDTDLVDEPAARVQTIAVREPVKPGENVTPPGSDMQPGDAVLPAGRRIGAPELAVLATLGIVDVPVYRRPVVAVLSTGDELVDPAVRPTPSQVRDSNRWALAGALGALGCTPIHLPTAPDTPDGLEAAVRAALATADAVVLTGGSSVGARDLTPIVIERIGRPGVVVHGLKVKPGKPTVLAMLEGKPVIGLPGNPASSLMILEAVVAPIFSALVGETIPPHGATVAVAGSAFRARPGWTWYVPAAVGLRDGVAVAEPLLLRSAQTSLLARAHGYVVVGPDVPEIPAGATVSVQRFSAGGVPMNLA